MRRTAGSDSPTITGFLIATITLALLVGCSDSNAPPKPSAPTPSKTTVAPEWESSYDEGQLSVYREAVQRVEAFETKVRPVYAEGIATKAAKELFQDNLLSWQSTWSQLQSYEKQKIKVARGPVVLRSEATSIKLLKDGAASVELTRCTDQTDLGGTMAGEPVAEAYDEPVVQQIDVYRYTDGRWRIGVFKTLEKTCEA